MRIAVKHRSSLSHVEKTINKIAVYYERGSQYKFHFQFGMQRVRKELMVESLLITFQGRSLVIYQDEESHHEEDFYVTSVLNRVYKMLIETQEKPEWSDFLDTIKGQYTNE